MSDLTDKQKALVDTIVATGCSIKDAAEKASKITDRFFKHLHQLDIR